MNIKFLLEVEENTFEMYEMSREKMNRIKSILYEDPQFETVSENFEVIINGISVTFYESEVDYVKLRDFIRTNHEIPINNRNSNLLTMTFYYTTSDDGVFSGSLINDHKKIKLVDGMVFNIMDTSFA